MEKITAVRTTTVIEVTNKMKDHPIIKVDIIRMRCSSGVINQAEMTLQGIDTDDFRVNIDRIWTSHTMKKYRTLSPEDFSVWFVPRLTKYLEQCPDERVFVDGVEVQADLFSR